MARAARSNYESTSEEVDTKRLALMIGGGLAAALVVVFLGVKMFGSKSETPRPAAPPVVHAPEYPQEVTDLIAQTEAAFKADDFKTARADVDKLRQLSPSHPRLDFFEGLLTARADAAGKGGAATAAAGRGVSKKNGKSPAASVTSAAGPAAGAASGASSSGSTAARSTAASTAEASPPGSPALPPETPVGFSRATTASSEPQHAATDSASASGSASGSASPAAAAATQAPMASHASAAATAPVAASEPAAASTAAPAPSTPEAAHTPAPTSSSARRASGEPPPVIQDAKLIRRVNPDYPSLAKKDGIAGSVDLEVTVSTQGVVSDVSVVQATPPDMFEKSALAAVRKWKYDPRFVDGLPSQAHLKVHVEFGPGK